ncbi:MAG: nicotinate (nicotinamide) nucleotide adenylyltransferase [Weeksellaceae bacterium]
MKIAILGGAFDPPHLGHAIVAQELLQHLEIDEVWLMPVYSHPLNKALLPAVDRLAMTKLLETEQIKVSDFEIKKADTSYTIETLQSLEKRYPEHEFSWCIGSDMLADFHKWKDWETLIAQYPFVIYPRGFSSQDLTLKVEAAFKLSPLPARIQVLNDADITITNISSTRIKTKLKKHESIAHLIPVEVQSYIKTNHLYER